MKDDTNPYVIVGKIGTAFGVKGWAKLISFTEVRAHILEYSSWYIETLSGWQPITIEAGKEHGKGLVVKLTGIETPEQVRLLTGKKLAVKRSQLPVLKSHEYYWSDLEGLTVIDQHNAVLGKVIYLIETGANDVLVVKGDKEYAIPYLPGKVVVAIDLDKKIMHVNWDMI